MEADLILLAKNVDGVYDSDPKLNPTAIKFEEIAYLDVISKGLQAMDTTSVTLCMENNIPFWPLAFRRRTASNARFAGKKSEQLSTKSKDASPASGRSFLPQEIGCKNAGFQVQ